MTKIERYPSQVFWSEEDGGFIALAPDLPGCSAFGETKGEALAELDHAVTAWIGAAEAAGNPVPEPSELPVPSSYSGKVLLRLPKELHAKLAQSAKRQDVSLNQYLLYVIATGEAHVSHVNPGSTGVTGSNVMTGGAITAIKAPVEFFPSVGPPLVTASGALHSSSAQTKPLFFAPVTPNRQWTAQTTGVVVHRQVGRGRGRRQMNLDTIAKLQSQTGNG
ncbi:toxin-antitoxin system HicB family antitoxin [Methylocystis sp.]|uniref:toxin-antitoxin system HicB family antitoxin n=1 Tax=Methylocystis sp. TaxID=1911079 RepID=UPI003D0EEFBD